MFSHDPCVIKYCVTMPKPTLMDQRSDEKRLLDSLRERYTPAHLTLDYDAALQLPLALREKDWKATAVVYDGSRVIGVESGDSTETCYGFAVDIGTTKLAGFLVDLVRGNALAVSSMVNPQSSYGADVISRISYAIGGKPKLRELQKSILEAVNRLINDCCRKAGVSSQNIYELVGVGNTCMHHLFMGISPRYLATSPYVPVLGTCNIKASRLGLRMYSGGNIYMAPAIAGFVGGDSVADLLVSRIFDSDSIILAIDIGTNTEIALGNKERVMVASCASGPAFEGMQIKHGMQASPGAIERVSIDPKTLEVHFGTVDDGRPLGICGTGLIDTVAGLVKSGIVDRSGRFVKKYMSLTDRLREEPNGLEFVIVRKDEDASEMDVTLTQADVRELQKAKAAIHTGILLLMKKMKIEEREIGKVIVAGAFGNYIDIDSARVIGMYPELPLDKFVFVGNSAGTGARMMLLSRTARRMGEKIANEVNHLELAAEGNFEAEFMMSLYLPYQDLNAYPMVGQMIRQGATYRG